jgi:acetate kinase
MRHKDQTNKSSLLVLNPGSSSLKWSWLNNCLKTTADLSGVVSYDELKELLKTLYKKNIISLAVVRFVHGGREFSAATIITDRVLKKLEGLNELAPLHNPKSMLCVQTLNQVLPLPLTCIAVFDTEFFNQLPLVSQTYGLPNKLSQKYSIRRYGFHGFAHDSMLNFWRSLYNSNENFANLPSRLITMQLGSGCSIAAIKDGKPIDTTMGFTPNEGLLMATRCGDIDPGIVSWLQRQENLSAEELDKVLNLQSGLLGVSGESSDMAVLLKSQSKLTKLAIELFCWRIRKTIGAYFAILGGLDGIILSGGIAENSSFICRRFLAELAHLGIALSSDDLPVKSSIRLTTDQSKVACWIVENNESQSILCSLQNNTNCKKLLEGENYVSHA